MIQELLLQINQHPDYLKVISTRITHNITPLNVRSFDGNMPELVHLISDLSKLTYENKLEPEQVNMILDSLVPLMESTVKISKLVISCIGNICIGAKLPLLQRIVKILSNKLSKESDEMILAVTLKSLSVVFNENNRIANEAIVTLLAKIETFAFLDGSLKNTATSQSEDDSMSDGEIITKTKRNLRIQPEWKLQIQALACLESLTRQSPKLMYSHWPKFLPAHSETRKSLMYIILLHPSESVRQSACKVVISFFTGGKQYLSIASHGSRSSSFTSLSQLLADQIYVAIEILLQCLKQPSGPSTTAQLYNLLNSILTSCNLRNLKGDFGPVIFNTLQETILNANSVPAFLVLECLSSLLAHWDLSESERDQTLSIVLKHSITFESATLVAVFNLIGAMGEYTTEFLWSNWIHIGPILKKAFASQTSAEALAGLRALEKFINAAHKIDSLVLPIEWWVSVMDSTRHLWMNDIHGIRCVSCHIIGHIPPDISDSIDANSKKTIISTVLALAQDQNVDVKAAACGTIGALSYFSWVRSDITILSGFARRLPGLCDDTNLKVRIRSFWAVGSLVDALKSRNDDFSGTFSNISLEQTFDNTTISATKNSETIKSIFDLSTELKLALLRSVIAGCRDQDKVKSFAFRALGRMIDMVPGEELYMMIDALDNAMSSLVSSLTSGPMKNRWNACYCLKSFFGYEGFPLGKKVKYTRSPFKSLVEVSTSSTNFKVKTGSILALASISTFERFETPHDKAEETIRMILEGMAETANSIDIILIRATNEEHAYLSQLLDALSNLLNHLESVALENWTTEMESLKRNVLTIMDKIGKLKTSFDPHGL